MVYKYKIHSRRFWNGNSSINRLRSWMNCIQEGLIPVKYYEQIGQELFATNKGKLEIEFKL